MRILLIPALLIVLSVSVGCGSRDPLDAVRESHPGASEYVAWKNYVVVRFAVDDVEPDLQPAVLLRSEAGEWLELGRSDKGFFSLHEVVTYIPEMDESGVAAFDLR